MNPFTSLPLANTTTELYNKYLQDFLSWTQGTAVDTPLIFQYIQHLQLQGLQPTTINRQLYAIKLFYNITNAQPNPVGSIKLQAYRTSVVNQVIDYQIILDAYHCMPNDTPRNTRNKLLFSCILFQALSTQDLHTLQPQHIDLQNGILSAPGTRRLNHRNIPIQVPQLLLFVDYLQNVRPTLLQQVHQPQAGPKTAIDHNIRQQLFFSRAGSSKIKNSLTHLFRNIRQIQPKIISTKQVRASVIAHWLRQQDIRKVQYLAGHRHIDSTEAYNLYKYEALKNQLHKYHPLANST